MTAAAVNVCVHLLSWEGRRAIPSCGWGEDKGRDVCFSTGTRSVKIRKHLVILLMSFVALSDHTRRASAVNNGGKCNYSQSNYSLQLCLKDDFETAGAAWWSLVPLPPVLTAVMADSTKGCPRKVFTAVAVHSSLAFTVLVMQVFEFFKTLVRGVFVTAVSFCQPASTLFYCFLAERNAKIDWNRNVSWVWCKSAVQCGSLSVNPS